MSEVVCKGEVKYSTGFWERYKIPPKGELDPQKNMGPFSLPDHYQDGTDNLPFLIKPFFDFLIKPSVGKEVLRKEIAFWQKEIAPRGEIPSKESMEWMKDGYFGEPQSFIRNATIVYEVTVPIVQTIPGLIWDSKYEAGEATYRVFASTDVQCEYVDEITPVPDGGSLFEIGMADLIGHDTIHLDSGDLLKLGAVLMGIAECDTDKTDVTYKDFMGRNSHWSQDTGGKLDRVTGYSEKNRLALEDFQHEAIPMNYDNVRMQMKEGLKWAINHSDMSDEGKEAAKNLILGDYSVGSFNAGVMLDNASRVLRLVETFKKNDWWTNGLTLYSREIPVHYEAMCSTYPRNQEACNRMATDGTVEYYDPF